MSDDSSMSDEDDEISEKMKNNSTLKLKQPYQTAKI